MASMSSYKRIQFGLLRRGLTRRPLRSLSHASRRQRKQLDLQHHDLPSFVSYASRHALPPDSTVYVGTHYEYAVAASLKRLGFHLSRTGGAGDCGIDLLGTWKLPTAPNSYPLHVLIQCKALAKRAAPNLIRELEGSLNAAPTEWKMGFSKDFGSAQVDRYGPGVNNWGRVNVMTFLVTPNEATRGVRDALSRSRTPMGFIKADRGTGRIEQMLWNTVAEQRGLAGIRAVQKIIPQSNAQLSSTDLHTAEKEVVLTWKGRAWELEEPENFEPEEKEIVTLEQMQFGQRFADEVRVRSYDRDEDTIIRAG